MVLALLGLAVFQHLTAPTSGQPPMANLKPGTTYNHRVCAIDKAVDVSPGALIKARVKLSFLPLLLEN